MPHDRKILSAARERLEQLKQNNQDEESRRRAEISAKIPEIPLLEQKITALMAMIFKLSLSKGRDFTGEIAQVREQVTDARMRKAELLTEHGYPIDYLDEIISCPLCRDTGVYEGGVCSCLEKLYSAELSSELSALIRNGDESFENFDLNLYPDAPGSKNSPRAVMTLVSSRCRKFADNFPEVASSLLMRGGAGTGKSYLAACIARVVSSKAFSVCYDSASGALGAFEARKFSRSAEAAEEAERKVRRMLECDLMILDDLGTEMTTSFTVSALYDLINERLLSRRPMIICTSLSDEEIARKYGAQIASRIAGEFAALPFVGDDIRRIKNR